jgi:hypothetical protein
MTLTALQALTWSTVTGAVVSALLLASGESSVTERSTPRRGDTSLRASVSAGPTVSTHNFGPSTTTVSDTLSTVSTR